jgi:dienelactone hydrolase
MTARGSSLGGLLLASRLVLGLCGGCTPFTGGDSGAADDPSRPGLAFSTLPAAANVNGRFEVWARINDVYGHPRTDSETEVSIRATGTGTLHGTLTRRAIAGQVVFDDLVHDAWETISLTLSAPGFGDVSTRQSLPVRPLMRFVTMPPDHAPVDSPLGPVLIELVDGRGRQVTADQAVTLDSGETVEAAGGPDRRFTAGQVTYDQIILHGAGARTLVWRSPGLSDLVHAVMAHEGEENESLWLPAGRIGVPYHVFFPGPADDFRLVADALPRGLTLEPTGELHGVPTSAGHFRMAVFGLKLAGASVLWKADLSIFPETEVAATSLDALDVDGPFSVGSRDDTVDVPSRKTSVRLRSFFPAQGDGVAAGIFPLVVFHHGALVIDPGHPTVFDRFDHLLRRWASYGFVVASIDAPDLVWVDGRLVSSSLSNLNAMSENQRAAIAYFKARASDPAFPLAGHVDVDRIVVAGHSRGGGASIITAQAEASVVGGILIKPLDPMGTVGGENVWSGPLPAKPFLLVMAGADADLPYPVVDFLYERRAGPMIAPTIVGSVHNFTCDASCPPEAGAVPGITREEDWAVTNAYATAFLAYVARGDLSYAPLLFGREGMSTHLASRGVLVRSDRAASSLLIDDFQQDTAGRNRLGLACTDTQMSWSADEPSLIAAIRSIPMGYDFYRILYERAENLLWSNAHRLQWSEDGATYRTELGGLDARGRAAFVWRARSDQGTVDASRVSLRFSDGAGHTATLPGAGHLGENGIGARFSDVIVPVAEIEAQGIDLSQLTGAEIVLQGTGAMLVDDLRFE